MGVTLESWSGRGAALGPRLRWRLRGAWQWPAFVVLTVLDGVLLDACCRSTRAARRACSPGVLLAGFVNLLAVAVIAPLVGLRAAPPPAGPAELIAARLRGHVAAARRSRAAFAGRRARRTGRRCAAESARGRGRARDARLRDLAGARVPRAGWPRSTPCGSSPTATARACPGRDRERWLCLFVSTDQQPPGGHARPRSGAERHRLPPLRRVRLTASAEVAPLDDHRVAVDAGLAPVERDLERDHRASVVGRAAHLRAARAALPQTR